MREWIQTGVLVIAGAAVIVGVVFMGIMLGRMNTANESVAAAIEQVAASNDALLAALNRLGAGDETAVAQELSAIEVVVRRGSETGPPAPEVQVELRGKGPNDQTMTVAGELNSEGRVVFERLYQGSYALSLEDPQSGLYAGKSITLFAGKGEGEYLIVAPDVEPRPIHIDWGLSAYAPEDKLYISTVLASTWEYGGVQWVNVCGAVSNRGETRQLGERAPNLKSGHKLERPSVLAWNALSPPVMAGEIAVVDHIGVVQSENGNLWQVSDATEDLADIAPAISTVGRVTTRRRSVAPPSSAPKLEGLSNGNFRAELPALVREAFGRRARLSRNIENVSAAQYAEWMERAAEALEDDLVIQAGGVHEHRYAEWVDGLLYAPTGEPPYYVGENFEGNPRVLALPLPPLEASSAGKRQVCLAIQVSHFNKIRRSPTEGGRTDVMDDTSGNTLSAYAIRSPWQDQVWPSFSPESPSAGGATIQLDDTPFWQMASEALKEDVEDGSLFIRVPRRVFDPGDAPVTGVLLRWEQHSDEFFWLLELPVGESAEYSPCWMITEPAEGAAPTAALKDIDGRFHYDAAMPVEVEPGQPRPNEGGRTVASPLPPGATLNPESSEE